MRTFAWLRSDPSLKIASLVLAIFVWMYVRSEEKPIQVVSVPLELSGLPDDLALSGRTLEHVTVRVRAREATLRNLTPEGLRAAVHLQDAQPGELHLDLTPSIVHAPLGVEVLSVDPPQLTVMLERRTTRVVPVVARFRGSPEPPLEQAGYTIVPNQVTVQGPERVVRQVRQAVTDEVDLTGRKSGFESVVAIQPDRTGARIVDKAVAVVKVQLSEPPATRTFEAVPLVPVVPGRLPYEAVPLVPVVPGRLPYEVRCHPETITVVLEGPGQTLEALERDNIVAELDLEGMAPRGAPYAVQPRVSIQPERLRAGVAVRSISHPTIHVTVSRKGAR
jgi:YbbR domain-containing protein